MKRKLFTLLFALVAVVAFQAKAQTATWPTDLPSYPTPTLSAAINGAPYSTSDNVKYWIKVDTTGFEYNTDSIPTVLGTAPYDAYPSDKYGLYNWLRLEGSTGWSLYSPLTYGLPLDNDEAIYKDANALFSIARVNNDPRWFQFTGANGLRFHVVYPEGTNRYDYALLRFNGTTFEAQAFSETGKDSAAVAGYLALGNANEDKEPDDLERVLVGYDDCDGKIIAKKFGDVAYSANEINNSPLLKVVNAEDYTPSPGKLYSAVNGLTVETYVDGVPYLDSLAVLAPGDLATNYAVTPGTAGAREDYTVVWGNKGSRPGNGQVVKGTRDSLYTYIDLDLSEDGVVSFRDVSYTIDEILTELNSGAASSTHALLARDTSVLVYKWNMYLISKNGKLEVTFPKPGGGLSYAKWDTVEWTNGQPQQFTDDTIYLLNIAGTGKSLYDTFEAISDLLGVTEPFGQQEIRYFLEDGICWQPIFLYITPSCSSLYYDYVSKEWLGANQLDLVANNHILAEINTETGLHQDITTGFGYLKNNETGTTDLVDSKDAAAKILYERAGFFDINGGYNYWDPTAPATAKPAVDSITAPIDTIDIYRIQNGAGKYLTLVPKSKFNDVGADPNKFVINGIQYEWADSIAAPKEVENDLRATQLFAIVGSYDAQRVTGLTIKEADGIKQYETFLWVPVATYTWKPQTGVFNEDARGKVLTYNSFIGDSIVNTCGQPRYVIDSLQYVAQHARLQDANPVLVIADPKEKGGFDRLYVDLFDTFETCDIETDCAITIQDKDGKYLVTNFKKDGQVTGETPFNGDDIARVKNSAEAIYAHWYFDKKDGKYSFNSEIESLFENCPDQSNFITPSLDGPFLLTCKDGKYELIYGEYSPYKRETFTITPACDHEEGFYRLDEYIGDTDLALVENTWLNRNLSIYNKFGKITYLKHDGTAYAEGKEDGNKDIILATITTTDRAAELDTTWIRVYESDIRYLGKNETHEVPYYVFSQTHDGIEYFLRVQDDGQTVAWVAQKDKDGKDNFDLDVLLDFQQYPYAYPNYKFALPKLTADKQVNAGTVEFYLLTLEPGIDAGCPTGDPYLIAPKGTATDIVNAYRASTVVDGYSTVKGIYSFSAGNVDIDFAGWVDFDRDFSEIEWLDVTDAIEAENHEAVGIFTSGNIDLGTDFVAIAQTDADYYFDGSKEDNDKISFARLRKLEAAQEFTLEYTGTTKIGYTKRDIWYYRVRSNSGQGYLTDATGSGATTPKDTASYFYAGHPYHLAYFTTDVQKQEEKNNVKYDKRFVQTFGFKLNDPKEADPKQYLFRIVSNADFTVLNPKVRFVGMVDEHLIFVDDEKDATLFQWGKKNNGVYEGIEAVTEGAVYGVKGGIRVAGISGNVDVYSLEGRLIRTATVTGDATIDAPAGLYIVKTGANVRKVVVK
jgi:hypothetical protein